MRNYVEAARAVFGRYAPGPNTWPATSFTPDDPYGKAIADKMFDVELVLAKDLLTDIRDVPGAIVEFGVFEGRWLEYLIACSEALGRPREVWGFDSFEGLPAPTADDLACFHQGEFSATLHAVAARLRCSERPHVRLVKGWFADTLPTPQAQAIRPIAYARVDGDLYQSAVETLAFLTGRLSDGAILVFDDWTFDADKGETKAFFEWAPRSGCSFELIGHLGIGRLYLRVRR